MKETVLSDYQVKVSHEEEQLTILQFMKDLSSNRKKTLNYAFMMAVVEGNLKKIKEFFYKGADIYQEYYFKLEHGYFYAENVSFKERLSEEEKEKAYIEKVYKFKSYERKIKMDAISYYFHHLIAVYNDCDKNQYVKISFNKNVINVIQFLLNVGLTIDINKYNYDVQKIISRYCKDNFKIHNKAQSDLIKAVVIGDVSEVKRKLNVGANVRYSYDGENVLFFAIKLHKYNVFKELIKDTNAILMLLNLNNESISSFVKDFPELFEYCFEKLSKKVEHNDYIYNKLIKCGIINFDIKLLSKLIQTSLTLREKVKKYIFRLNKPYFVELIIQSISLYDYEMVKFLISFKDVFLLNSEESRKIFNTILKLYSNFCLQDELPSLDFFEKIIDMLVDNILCLSIDDYMLAFKKNISSEMMIWLYEKCEPIFKPFLDNLLIESVISEDFELASFFSSKGAKISVNLKSICNNLNYVQKELAGSLLYREKIAAVLSPDAAEIVFSYMYAKDFIIDTYQFSRLVNKFDKKLDNLSLFKEDARSLTYFEKRKEIFNKTKSVTVHLDVKKTPELEMRNEMANSSKKKKKWYSCCA